MNKEMVYKTTLNNLMYNIKIILNTNCYCDYELGVTTLSDSHKIDLIEEEIKDFDEIMKRSRISMQKEQQYKLAVEDMVDAINLILSEQINEYYDYITGEMKPYTNEQKLIEIQNEIWNFEEIVKRINEVEKIYE